MEAGLLETCQHMHGGHRGVSFAGTSSARQVIDLPAPAGQNRGS
jgi:hypothetical protein